MIKGTEVFHGPKETQAQLLFGTNLCLLIVSNHA